MEFLSEASIKWISEGTDGVNIGDNWRILRNSASGTMPKRKGRGRPKKLSVQEFQEGADGNSDILVNPPEVVEVQGVSCGEEEQEADTGTRPKRKRLGRPRGSKVLKNCQNSADGDLDILVNPSKIVKVGSDCGEEQEADAGNARKRKRQGRPRGSMVEKKGQDSADGNLNFLISSSNLVGVGPGSEEEQEAVPKNGFEDCKLDILINPSHLVEVATGCREEQEADAGNTSKRMGRGRPRGSTFEKKVQESADGNLNVLINPSNLMGVGTGFEEEREAGNIPKRKGRGRPKGLANLRKCEMSADGNLDILISPSNLVEVDTGSREEQEADTFALSKRRGRGRPKGSMGQKKCRESPNGNLEIIINPSNIVEVGPGCEAKQEAVPERRGRGRPRGSAVQQIHEQDLCPVPKRKGRGRTRGLRVQMKRQQSADGKLDVLIHPTKLVAVGPGRKDFITDLSVIVRQHARHNVYKWKQVPQSIKDIIVQNTLNGWRLQDTPLVRRAILDEAGRLYRNWRNRLHSHYLMFETKEEALKNAPDDINESDWPILVDYFSSSAFETMSTINKANKAKQMINHACGPKSFQAVSYDARDLVTGMEPDMHTLWQLTHKRNNGEWVDEASKEIHDKVTEQIIEKIQVEDSGDEMGTIEPEIIDAAFRTVVGKKSYMQGRIAGLSSSSLIRVQQLQSELDAKKREAEEFRIKFNEVRAKLDEFESQLEEERQRREEIEARLLDRQREMHEINSQVQTAIQAALSEYKLPIAEAENSLKQKRKIAELEAQLHEAEDVITDLRAELRRYGMR